MSKHAPRLGIVVLAAGEGTRMRSQLNKILHPLCGRPLVGHVLALADDLRASATTVVLAPHTLEPVQQAMGARYTYVVQSERLGTGHAVAQARGTMRGQSDYVLVLYGDTPLLRAESAAHLYEMVREHDALAGLISFQADPPTGYGRVLRDENGTVLTLIEERDATDEQRRITEANSGVMCFEAEWLWERVGQIARNQHKNEYYLTDLVAMAVAERGPGAAVAHQIADPTEAWGINDRAQLAEAETELRRRINQAVMLSGVTLQDPASTYIDVGVTVGADSYLLPGSVLRGTTSIGARCVIGPHTTLIDTVIGDDAHVQQAYFVAGNVAPGTTVLPFTYFNGTASAANDVPQRLRDTAT